jgi:hypothetical protein
MACFIRGLLVPRFLRLLDRWLDTAAYAAAQYSCGIYLTHCSFNCLALIVWAISRKFRCYLDSSAALPAFSVHFYHQLELPMIGLGKKLTDRILDSQPLG